MKLKRSIACFCLIVFSLSTCMPLLAQGRATTSAPVVGSPEIMIKEFYKWYINVLSHDIDPLKAGKATLKKYVTVRFIREIERNEKLPEGVGFDADYFLQTQDPLPSSTEDEADWQKNISISKVAVRGSTATAIVTFFKGYPRVGVSLIKEGSTWKINKVTEKRK